FARAYAEARGRAPPGAARGRCAPVTPMDLTLTALLAQDGITNGAIYALLALAIVLVFAVTRVIFVPAGEFVAYGALTLAALQLGKPPGTVGLLAGLALATGITEVWVAARRRA